MMSEGAKEAISRAMYHLAIFQKGSGKYGVIDRELTKSIQEMLDTYITTPYNETDIDVWLDSPGGDADATYKMFLVLRSRCHCLRVVIPDYARSAATLLTLGMDSIFMSRTAELGPIDVQISHPSREDEMLSCVDIMNAIGFLTTIGVDATCREGSTLIEIAGLSKYDAFHESLRFMSRFLQPLAAQLDPHLVNSAVQQLKVPEEYAVRMMKTRIQNGITNEDDIRRLVQKMVNGYPSHNFIISRNEARELGLPVVDAEAHPRWQYVQKFFDLSSMIKEKSLIFVAKDADLEKMYIKVKEVGIA
jgi:hypothetical protein